MKDKQTDAELQYEAIHAYFLHTLLFLRRCCKLCTFRLKYLERNLTFLTQSKALLQRDIFL